MLIVEPGEDGSRFFRTPDATPADNQAETRSLVELHPAGDAKLALQVVSSGSSTPGARRLFESPVERRTHAEELLARAGYPGASLSAVEVSDPHAVEQPFEVRIAAVVANFASPSSTPGGLEFSPFGQRSGFVETLAPLSQRKLPLQLPEAQSVRQLVAVELPKGYTAALPSDAEGDSPQGRWAIHFASDVGTVRAQLNLALNGGGLQPEDYAEYRAMLGQLE